MTCTLLGISARFAKPTSHQSFWQALVQGQSLPSGMSDARLALQRTLPGPGWGAAPAGMFLEDIDRFDRQLFAMAPPSLVFADPRQRLLLEAVWRAIEDAGINSDRLRGKRVGVFIAHDGWYLGTYASGILPSADIQEFVVPGNDPCFLANRISSVFHFTGPSIAFDTTCSGALTALHYARQALQNNECDFAVVAAVTLFLRPWSNGEAAATPFESRQPTMSSFMVNADGYITSEGCGAVFLADAQQAEHELGAIAAPYATMVATGTNSGGKTASFAQPCREQQSRLLTRVLSEAKVHSTEVNYVEAHGVATLVGDAIEGQAISDTFGDAHRPVPCTISCIKPNLGHTHAASGVYALLKTLLSMQHQKIAPIRGFDPERLNPEIRLREGVQFADRCIDWQTTGSKRLAVITSYGLSNVNAAVVLQACSERRVDRHVTLPPPVSANQPQLICVSATTKAQLLHYVRELLEYARSQAKSAQAEQNVSLTDFAYSLACCRKPLPVRWVSRTHDWQTLCDQFEQYLALDPKHLPDSVTKDHFLVVDTQKAFPGKMQGDETTPLPSIVEDPLAQQDWSALAKIWALGHDLPWSQLFPPTAKAVRLPEYPFARQRYWIPEKTSVVKQTSPQQSSATEVRFARTFSGTEFFLDDHQIQKQRILPAVMHLEMVRDSIARQHPRSGASVVTLSNLTWQRPLLVDDSPIQAEICLTASDHATYSFEVRSHTAGSHANSQLHSSGVAAVDTSLPGIQHSLSDLQQKFKDGVLTHEQVYDVPEYLRLYLGPRLRGVRKVLLGEKGILAEIRLPELTENDFGLHPSVMDPILQVAFLALSMRYSPGIPLTIPFYLEQCNVFADTTPHMWAWIRYAQGSEPGDRVEKLDVDLLDDQGVAVMTLRGFSFRKLDQLGRFASDSTPAAVGATSHTTSLANAARTATAKNHIARRSECEVATIVQQCLAEQLSIPISNVQPHTAFETLGLDSILIARITTALEQHFGSLPKTLMFEHQSVAELTAYLSNNVNISKVREPDLAHSARPLPTANMTSAIEPIAVVGLSGQYPAAKNIGELWDVLKQGRDCIKSVPNSRWAWQDYYDESHQATGHHHSRWGGFIDDIDKFDPLLFNISPKEAAYIDPQERLILQHAWAALEDAGYSKTSLARTYAEKAGVYVGVMYGQYQMLASEFDGMAREHRLGFAATLGSIANRVSYVFGFSGPSMVLDTQCSSSLTALHVACRDLRASDVDIALAGGVNLTLHPAKYLELSRRKFISTQGKCESFGKGGAGYVPSEGVGVAVLKRLSTALQDGDHIYGVILGSAINHGGKTSGYTVPHPKAQAQVIASALAEAKIDSSQINYVEAHGTGTVLGDPIEVSALASVFARQGDKTPVKCYLGSIKSNLGHCESAAGIAGLSKVLLQLQHQQIAPSLHSSTLNPNIDFAQTPFEVNQQLRDWVPLPNSERADSQGSSLQTLPRTAGLSSFGAGGANAHVIVQEYTTTRPLVPVQDNYVIPISAATDEALQKQLQALAQFVAQQTFVSAQDEAEFMWALSCTLHLGREALPKRLGLLVQSHKDLLQRLLAYLSVDQALLHGVFSANAPTKAPDNDLIQSTADVANRLNNNDWAALLRSWVHQGPVDLNQLWGNRTIRRLSMPTYPFAKERYWITDLLPEPSASRRDNNHALHPLLHENCSDLQVQRYRTVFTGDEIFLREHRYQGERILPGAITAHLFVAATQHAAQISAQAVGRIRLRNLRWLRPAICSEAGLELTVEIAVRYEVADDTRMSAPVTELELRLLQSSNQEDLLLVAECMADIAASDWLVADTRQLPELHTDSSPRRIASDDLYQTFERLGLNFGPAFRHISEIQLGVDAMTSILCQGSASASAVPQNELFWPDSLLDAAFQCTLCGGLSPANPSLATLDRMPLPSSMQEIRFSSAISPIETIRAVPVDSHCQRAATSADLTQAYDLELLSGDGRVQMQISGFVSAPVMPRDAVSRHQSATTVFAHQQWQTLQTQIESMQPASAVEGTHCVLIAAPHPHHTPSITNRVYQRTGAETVHLDIQPSAERWLESYLQIVGHVQCVLQHHDKMNESASTPQPLLFQLIVPATSEWQPLSAVQAMLQSIALERPAVLAQTLLIELPYFQHPDTLVTRLRQLAATATSGLYRVGQHGVSALVNQPLPIDKIVPEPAWRDDGVYVLSGGAGGLGKLFANDILACTTKAHVVLLGRRQIDAALHQWLTQGQGRLHYRRVDICDDSSLRCVLDNIRRDIGSLRGVMQLAGVTADSQFDQKTREQVRTVLAPKVQGTLSLDRCTQHDSLDWFVVFSSVAGVTGNQGQADYALANAFLTQFAHLRTRQVEQKQRSGKSIAISWPLMADGGMTVTEQQQKHIEHQLGMIPMDSRTALHCWYRILHSAQTHVILAQGDETRLAQWLSLESSVNTAQDTAAEGVVERVEALLCEAFEKVLGVPKSRIDRNQSTQQLGFDSVTVVEISNYLQQQFAPVSQVLFYEHPTIAKLARHLVQAHTQQANALLNQNSDTAPHSTADQQLATLADSPAAAEPEHRTARFLPPRATQTNAPTTSLDIAVIGVSGQYPGAYDLPHFWQNLIDGIDSTQRVPQHRLRLWYADQDPVPSQSAWGGFIDDIETFDHELFGIDAHEAACMDPQERKALELVWAAIEDAGYRHTKLGYDGQKRRVGVYIGAMYGQYQLYGATGPHAFAGSQASIANRVSYCFDFVGPSLVVDSMCSSGATAIELACQALNNGSISVAVAGGVNIASHPNKFALLRQHGLLAETEQGQSFGSGRQGYVPGEGAGIVILKRLPDALADGDQIHGVILGCATAHTGQSNGYRVPEPNAEAAVIQTALQQAGVSLAQVSYIEAHATGTPMGDQIEVAALQKVAAASPHRKQRLMLGSVKANIGHGESAAAVSALTKVLLQFRYRRIPPTLYAKQDLVPDSESSSPFIINQRARDWHHSAAIPRVVGISSFGAGGTNNHMVVREAIEIQTPNITRSDENSANATHALPFSARSTEQLRAAVERMFAYLEHCQAHQLTVEIADIAYTLQTGRESFPYRMLLLSDDTTTLREQLRQLRQHPDWIADKTVLYDTTLRRQSIGDDGNINGMQGGDTSLTEQTLQWLRSELAQWPDTAVQPSRRVSLPTHPFARIPCWWTHFDSVADGASYSRRDKHTGVSDRNTAQWPDSNQQSIFSSLCRAVRDIDTRLSDQELVPDTRLSDLGLDSLHIVRLIEWWQLRHDKQLSQVWFFEAKTVADLVRLITELGPHIESSNEVQEPQHKQLTDEFISTPMSNLQQAFVFGRRIKTYGRYVTSNVYVELLLPGALDLPRLQSSWQQLIDHHQMLRCRIDDHYQLTPHKTTDLILDCEDRDTPSHLRLRQQMSERVFDLCCWPAFDIKISRLSEQHNVMHFVIDEVFADAYSVLLLMQQWQQLYQQRIAAPPVLEYSYVKHLKSSQQQQSETYQRGKRYWLSKLQEMPEGPQLEHAEVSTDSPSVHCLEHTLMAEDWNAIKRLASGQKTHASTVLLALFCQYLHQQLHQSHFSINITRLNRPPYHAQAMQVVGLFANSQVFISQHTDSIEEAIRQTQQQLEEDAKHFLVDAIAIKRELRSHGAKGGQVELPVVFTSLLSSAFDTPADQHDWQIQHILNSTPQVCLDFQVLEVNGEAQFRWFIGDSLYQSAQIHRLFRGYFDQLHSLSSSSHSLVSSTVDRPNNGQAGHNEWLVPTCFAMSDLQVAYAGSRSGLLGEPKPSVVHLQLDMVDFDRQRFAWVIHALLEAHPMLSARLTSQGQILPQSPTSYQLHEATACRSEADFEAQCKTITAASLVHTFPLDQHRFFDVQICAWQGHSARIFLTIDLLIADGRSANNLCYQLLSLYHGIESQPTVTSMHFWSYLAQKQQGLDDARSVLGQTYWKEKFRQLPSGPQQWLASAGTPSTLYQLSERLPMHQQLQDTAAQLDVSLDALLCHAYMLTLRQAGQSSPFAVVAAQWDRAPHVDRIDELVGDFTRLAWVPAPEQDEFAVKDVTAIERVLRLDQFHSASMPGTSVLRQYRHLVFPVVYTGVLETPQWQFEQHHGRAMPPDTTLGLMISNTANVVLDCVCKRASRNDLLVHWDTKLPDKDQMQRLFADFVRRISELPHSVTEDT